MRRAAYVLGLVVAGLLSAVNVSAEEPAPGGQGGQAAGQGGGNRGRGQFDMEQFRQRMMDRVKENLGVAEDEWKVLQPKIDAVQKVQMQQRMSGMGSMFGRRRSTEGQQQPAAAAAPEPPKSETEGKTRELQTLVDNKDSDPKVVKAKLQELREAREKAKLELKKSQDELRELLTPRQEAQLVLMGILE